MGRKSAPPQPDYAQLAANQGAANQETARQQSLMNNPNQVTPYGTSTYTMGADGRPIRTDTLSPDEQAKLTGSNKAQLSSLDILNGDMPNIRDALTGKFGLAGHAREGYNPEFAPKGGMQYGIGDAGNIQRGLNFSSSPGLVGTDMGTRLLMAGSQYAQGQQMLAPQQQNEKDAFRADMANQGIVPGTEAFNRAESAMQRKQSYDTNNLLSSSISTGNTALTQQQAAALANRSQISGETAQQGQFSNAATQQLFDQLMGRANLNNSAYQGAASVASNEAGLENAGRAQNYNEYSTNRTMPINMLNSLISSSQVNNPTFQPTAPTSIAPPPIMQGGALQGQAATAGSNAQNGITGSIVSGLTTAAAVF